MDGGTALESEDAIALAAGLSSLTASLKKLSYNYGVTVGRAVYRLFEERRHYRWYGDSIQDVILFFETIGYDYILYKILTDNVEVSIYRKNRVRLGCNIHSFDAGIMAGFLGAARGEFVRVTETSCCNNGAECCRFTTAPGPGDPFCSDLRGVAKLFTAPRSSGRVRQEYQVLCVEPLTKAGYANQINAIIAHLGREAAGEMPAGRLSAKAMERAGEAMERFGLGRLEYSARPQRAEILLHGAKAKKEFVDISISFLNGVIGGHFGARLKPRLTAGGKGSYKIVIKQ